MLMEARGRDPADAKCRRMPLWPTRPSRALPCRVAASCSHVSGFTIMSLPTQGRISEDAASNRVLSRTFAYKASKFLS